MLALMVRLWEKLSGSRVTHMRQESRALPSLKEANICWPAVTLRLRSGHLSTTNQWCFSTNLALEITTRYSTSARRNFKKVNLVSACALAPIKWLFIQCQARYRPKTMPQLLLNQAIAAFHCLLALIRTFRHRFWPVNLELTKPMERKKQDFSSLL